MVVNDDDVEWKWSRLTQSRFHGVGNGGHAVAHRYYHRCLNGKFPFIEAEGECALVEPCADAAQIVGEHLLALALHGGVAGIHVVKLLLARGAAVGHGCRVEIFRHMHYCGRAVLGKPEAQRIQAAMERLHRGGLGAEKMHRHHHQRAKIEIVAHRPWLVWRKGVRPVGSAIIAI